ncbi:MAG: RHS repeat-associated core domain-containing protein [Paludibacter sp.]|nr:RHS repeat-associated core domain-containing protein [Paludibacter sp.]
MRKSFYQLPLIIIFVAFSFLQQARAQWEVLNPDIDIRELTLIGKTFYGINNGMLVKSNNMGANWYPIPDFSSIGHFVKCNNKFVISGIYKNVRGLYYSDDNMQTWKKCNPNVAFQGVMVNDSAIFLLSGKDPYVYSPMSKSTDGGATWQIVNFDTEGKPYAIPSYESFYCNNKDIGVFIGRIGFFYSEDWGNTWKKVNNGLPMNEENYYDYASARVFKTGIGYTITFEYSTTVYYLKNDRWEVLNSVFYNYNSYNKEYLKDSHENRLFFRANKDPFYAGISGSEFYTQSGDLYLSSDKGKTWYSFTHLLQGKGSGDALIYGDYLYIPYGYNVQTGPTTFVYKYGFGRLKLSAVSEIINTETQKQKLATAKRFNSPYGRGNALGLVGANHFSELNELTLTDSEELQDELVNEFINDYGSSSKMSDYFGGGQPGMCSFMGMPSWSVNLYDLKLYIRDIIIRKKGKGPEIKLALNYVNSETPSTGMFGSNWKFEYEMSLLKMDSSFVLRTGQGAVFQFKDSKPVQLNATPFALTCIENSNFRLQWDGQQLLLNKLGGREVTKFIAAGENIYLPVSVEDSYGYKTAFLYDVQNRLVTITDASGRKYRMSYANNLCDSIISPDNRFATFSYVAGQLSSSVDFEGVETKYSYDSFQNITTADISGKITQFNYSFDVDSIGCVNSIVDPENRKTVYYVSLPDSLNSITTVVLPDQKAYVYSYYKGDLQSVTTNTDEAKRIYYNTNQQIDSLVWYDGSKIEFAYDNARNVIYLKDRKGEKLFFDYDANNNLISKTDRNGKVLLKNTYNNKNQIVSSEIPGNQITTYTYDEQGAVKSLQTSGGKSYSWTRDLYGNINSFTNPSGKTIHFGYNETGMQPVEKTDFIGNKYKLTYNNNGRLAKVSMPDGSFRDIYYDCCTQTGFTDENGQLTSVVRDATNRILEKNYPGGRKINYQYDENGYVKGFKNLYGTNISMTYNDFGKLTSVTDDEGTVRFDYNKNGLCNLVTDKLGNSTRYDYDNQMRLISKTNALGYNKIYSYNENNQLSSINDAIINKTRSFKYNDRGYIIEKSYESVPYASYTYDADNDLTSFTDSTGTTSYVRDNGGFISSVIYPGNKTVTFQYDDNGNLVKTIYPNGFEVVNQLNSLNRITAVTWNNASVSCTFDAVGNTLTEFCSNQVHSYYEYNQNNVLIKTEHATGDSLIFSEKVLSDSGIIKSIQIKSPVEMVKAPATITNATYNSLNQLSASGLDYRYYYDTEGNMTYVFNGSLNEMKAVYTPDNMLSYLKNGNNTQQITYDAMRYPRKLTHNGETVWLYYDHKGRLLFETDAAGNINRNYIYRGKRLIAYYDVATSKSYFYHFNRNGNTVAITDQDGAIQNAYVYSTGGQILGSKEILPNRNTFLGAFGAIKLDNDFVLTGSRVYSPKSGRFIQSDPLGIITGTNPYLYAENNPAAGIDPYGLANDQSTVNTLDFDPPSDNNYGTAAGTANPYSEGLKYRDSDWDTYGSAAVETFKDFKNSPASDFIPGKYMDPLTHGTAIINVSEGNFFEAAWQYMPFNNTLEAAGNAIQEHMKTVDPPSTNGFGILVTFGQNKLTQCDL